MRGQSFWPLVVLLVQGVAAASGCTDEPMPSTYSETFGETGGGPTPCEGDWNGICLGDGTTVNAPVTVRGPIFIEDLDRDGSEEIVFGSGQVLDLSSWPDLSWSGLALGVEADVVGTVSLGDAEPFGLLVLHDDGRLELGRSGTGEILFEELASVTIEGSKYPASYVVAADLAGYPSPGVEEVLVLEEDTIRVFSWQVAGFAEDVPISVEGCRGGMSVFRFDADPWDDIALGCEKVEIFRSAQAGILEWVYTFQFGDPTVTPIGLPRQMVEGGLFFPVLLEQYIWFAPRPSTGSDTLVGGSFGAEFGTLGWSSWPDAPILVRNGQDGMAAYPLCPQLDIESPSPCGLGSQTFVGLPAPTVANGVPLLTLVRDAGDGRSEVEIRPVTYHPAQSSP